MHGYGVVLRDVCVDLTFQTPQPEKDTVQRGSQNYTEDDSRNRVYIQDNIPSFLTIIRIVQQKAPNRYRFGALL